MNKVPPKQTCPFCEADWGTCDHYRILAEWEESAAREEPARRRPPTATELPPGDARIDPLT